MGQPQPIKFNYYSRILNKTLTVEGELKSDWSEKRFFIHKIYSVRHEPFNSDALHNEALEYFEIYKDELKSK